MLQYLNARKRAKYYFGIQRHNPAHRRETAAERPCSRRSLAPVTLCGSGTATNAVSMRENSKASANGSLCGPKHAARAAMAQHEDRCVLGVGEHAVASAGGAAGAERIELLGLAALPRERDTQAMDAARIRQREPGRAAEPAEPQERNRPRQAARARPAPG